MRTALVVAATLALLLAGCSREQQPGGSAAPANSGSETSTPAEGPTTDQGGRKPLPSEAPDDEAVEIEIEGDRVEPNGRQLAVAAGKPVTLAITSDRAAELHVHSSPEQMIEVAPGESTVRLTVDTPGVVDVEEHESGIVVLQLEVR